MHASLSRPLATTTSRLLRSRCGHNRPPFQVTPFSQPAAAFIRLTTNSSGRSDTPRAALSSSGAASTQGPTPGHTSTGTPTQASSPAQATAAMDPETETLINALHANPTKAVVYVTGGAVQALSWLLSVPGASNTIIEASVPYARESLMSTLQGQEPTQYCSEETAVQIAKAAYKRAAALHPGFGTPLIGVGATCALASVPLKRGEHRAFVACYGQDGTRTLSLTFAKGERSRVGEDDVASRAVVRLMAQAMGVDSASLPALPLITEPAGESSRVDVLREAHHPAPDPIEALLAGRVRCVEYGPGGQVVVDAPRTHRIFLPGSFNPLHQGHRDLLRAAVEQHHRSHGEQWAGCFELSVGNADKGWLPVEEVRRRLAQFTSEGLPVVLTAAPLYTLKSDLFKECRFVLGYDTAVRIVMEKYYGGGSFTAMLLDFAQLRAAGCSFLVAGRRDDATGSFKRLADVAVPPELAGLFEEVPETIFRVDLSSSELRKKAALEAQAQGAQGQ